MSNKIHYPQEAYATFLRVWYHLIPQLLRPFNLNRNQTFYLNGILSNAMNFIDYFQDDTMEHLKKNSPNWKKLSKEINFPTHNKDYIISQLEKQFNQFFVIFKEDEKKTCIANLLRDISRLRVYSNNWDKESILSKEVDDKDNGEKRNIEGLRNFFNFFLLTFEDICSNFGRDKVDDQLKIFLNFILNQTEFKGEDKNVEDYEKIFKDTNPLDNDRKNKILHLKDYIDDAMQNIDLREMFSYAFFNLIEEFEFDDYIISTKQSNFESNFNEFFTLYSKYFTQIRTDSFNQIIFLFIESLTKVFYHVEEEKLLLVNLKSEIITRLSQNAYYQYDKEKYVKLAEEIELEYKCFIGQQNEKISQSFLAFIKKHPLKLIKKQS